MEPTTSKQIESLSTDLHKFLQLPKNEEESINVDSETCPICFENWTTDGEHRLCSLRCGHLFGYKCIIRWLESEVRKCCPTCKMDVDINDIRHIFARKIIAVNTSELCSIKTQLEKEKSENVKMKLQLSNAISRENLLQQRLDECQRLLDNYKNEMTNRKQEIIKICKDKTIGFGKNSECNVLDAKKNSLIVIAMKSPLKLLFDSYGVRKYNLETDALSTFTTLHSAQIRDIKLHASYPWYLTCSFDKKIKVVNTNTDNVTMTFGSESPLWTCCWDPDYKHIFYVGQQLGSVLRYDVRHPSQPLCRYFVPGDFSPVVSVQAIKKSSTFQFGGVISCKLNSVWVFYNDSNGIIRNYQLPLEGPFTSMTYDNNTGNMFISIKPNLKYPYSRHVFYKLHKEDDGSIKCNVVHSFRGGTTQKMRSRSCLFPNSTYAATYIDYQQSVCFWNMQLGNTAATVTTRKPVLDIGYVETACADYILCLSEQKLKFYKITV